MKKQNLLLIVLIGIMGLVFIISSIFPAKKPMLVISGERLTEISELKTLKMTVFIQYATDSYMEEETFKNILDKCKIPYNVRQLEGSYRWYDFRTEGKKFAVGFAQGEIFSSHWNSILK